MSGPREATDDQFAVAILTLWAAATLFIALCWSAGQLALLLTGDVGVASPIRSPDLAIGLLGGHDPNVAWHHTYHSSASPVVPLFWTSLAILLLFMGAIAWLVTTRWTGLHATGRTDPAQWATPRQERRLAVAADPHSRRWRLLAGRGRASRRRLAGNDCVSAVVFGPNGSGKTTSLVVPNVLDWDGPVVLTTAKPQDLEPICATRGQQGPVWVVAPGGAPGHDCCGWSPIDGATDPESADRLAEWLVDSSGMAADPKSRPWNAQARKYLKGLLLATHLHGGGVVQWTRWIHSGERARDMVEDVLRSAGHDDVAQEYASTWSIHEEGKGSVLFTALGLADTYSRPGVLRAAERAGFDPGNFLNRSGTLCIVTPNAEGERFAPYFTALLSAVIREAEVRAARLGGPLEPRLLLALDEAGNVFRYPRLPHLLTTARGNGIQLLLIYHDLAQVEHLYGGREVARTVVSNAKMRMLLPGVGDLETLRYWSELIGQTRRQSHGTTTGADGRRSRSQSEHADHLAPLHRLQQLPDGEAVLLYQNLPPARVRLLPWYADRRFRDLAH
jgi:type IV secretory pathway TraG/TraD family ATPase VirD4